MKRAPGCRCKNPLFFTEEPEHCFRCGRGPCTVNVYGRRPMRRRRLPDDLGAFVREGRRPDPHLENVVRFDRLRPGPRTVPPVEWEEGVHEVRLSPGQERVLSLAADGLSNQQIANVVGTTTGTVGAQLAQAYQRIGLEPGQPGPRSANRAAAIEWWRSAHEGRLAA